MADETIRVAVRIRPLVSTEIERGCQKCLSVVPGEQQIQIRGSEKSFTYNNVFGPETDQHTFYSTAIKSMVDNIFKGYNVTILAYGQTGSGKTHSMGTNYTGEQSMGVIPRAVHDIFTIITSKKDYEFKVGVSFMELYQEQLYDLLSERQRSERIVDIREDPKGIKIVGLTEKIVTNAKETLEFLAQGSRERATGSTAMNSESSRSHAIFTIIIRQRKYDDPNSATTSKFHLVDLAGSERSKKTQATGERFKEGVNINKGLLALGNVISQLGELGGSATYIGYRDSKLTRLLQDSLGGNSMTLMIACVSPADYNLDETLSTLRYADRARKIKNKPIVNQDPKSAEINRLNALVQQMRLALVGGAANASCPPEHQELVEKNRNLQQKLREMTDTLNGNLIEIVNMHERAELAEAASERINTTIASILEEFEKFLQKFAIGSAEYSLIEPIYKKILELQGAQKKTAEDILNHELTSMSCGNKSNNVDDDPAQVSMEFVQSSIDEVCSNLDAKNEEHTLRQTERNHEIQNINRGLALKEELIATLMKNSSQIAEHSKELQEMENEIKTLQAEKEELTHALQNVQSNTASAKLAQSRRKKVQELEKKIAELSRKCTEQTRIIKQKEKSDQQIKNLSGEIHSLKQTKVKLIREMRKETERFNQWKRTSEKELSKLKEQDRKRQNQMTRLQTQHNKQQNVLKRKMEEASAVNKRLKEALELQQKAQAQRREKNASNKDSGITNWVRQEMAVLLSTVDAEASLEKLMQDRADLASSLETLKSSGKDSPNSKQQIADLTEYLDLRNAQIADLQKQIMESDQENRATSRWNAMQSMNDAKKALKILFENVAVERRKTNSKNQEHDDLMEKYDAAMMKIRQNELRDSNKNPDMVQRLQDLEKELESYKQKCEYLQEQVSTSEERVVKIERKKPKHPVRVRHLSESNYDTSVHISDDSIIEDDTEADPDWKKTPIYSRIQRLWNPKRKSQESDASKRSIETDVKCSCKTNCSTRLCRCRKSGASCENCNCNSLICKNKNNETTSRQLFIDETVVHEPNECEQSSKRLKLSTELQTSIEF